jgi:hypothetical protein
MRPALRKLFQLALQSDSIAEQGDEIWLTRCLHCRAKLIFRKNGEPIGAGSLEHVVPKSWFGEPAAAALYQGLASHDDPRNLALACRQCNNQKGYGPDLAGPTDEHAFQIVQALQVKRLARWRDLDRDEAISMICKPESVNKTRLLAIKTHGQEIQAVGTLA